MKKIGFIDYFLHNWHSSSYPSLIKEQSGGEMEVCYAYGKIDAPNPAAMTNAQWAENNNIQLLSSIEEVIEKSDYIMVLSPNNPEQHEELCQLPTACGGRVYIDKTFAPDKETALRIFERADKHHTLCFSSSALRFDSAYKNIDTNRIEAVGTWGEGAISNYSIHQLEPIVSLMGIGAKRVMYMGSDKFPSLYIEYKDGRHAQMACYPKRTPFLTNVGYNDGTTDHLVIQNDFYANLMKSIVNFFNTGEVPVPHEQTVEVIAIWSAGMRAMEAPFTWVNV